MVFRGPVNSRPELDLWIWISSAVISLMFSRSRFPKCSVMLNQAVCSKLSGVSSPSCFFSQRISTSWGINAGLCFVDEIFPSRASSTRWALGASFAGSKSLSVIMLNFVFVIQIPIQASSNCSHWIAIVIFAVMGASFDVETTQYIYELFFCSPPFVNSFNGLLMAFSFRQAQRKLKIL